MKEHHVNLVYYSSFFRIDHYLFILFFLSLPSFMDVSSVHGSHYKDDSKTTVTLKVNYFSLRPEFPRTSFWRMEC
jgi:hypothetical protein